MKLFANKSRRLKLLTIVTATAVMLLASAQVIATWQSSQVAYYNRGVELYQKGDVDGALKAFDQSLNAYHQEQSRSWLEKALLPAPSQELAGLAQTHEGVLWILKKKPEQAVASFKESIKLLDPNEGYLHLSTADAKRLTEEGLVPKYDLELLFKKNPSLAQQQGQGQGQGQGQKQGTQPTPGNDPGRQAGKGNKDDI